ncbi:uncharacterized protein LOC131892166 [Tigriopus californicus]|uniref:uncharacterized protein LOC131892166 n=1 Tax=Tigriopus californicus TaxID=6832 RepID=UPI0027DA4494|nr:uncharacterized protein LOC131892166 [Tigriopus californicus]XP_059097926.1 uncharacterized protein LOC131892166 [Tigriopus californicus]XP_059097927.1 uncharacterized protein LOC131892166 [Tigriopus californicus]XP_059097928.1 uncharacterized protein LOC131892166 [Tigriopus californicus]XP_059097929.1 uncharacterized protein LOC131892166 [Tigriopus californicus]
MPSTREKDVCKHRTKARSFRGTFYVAQVEYALDMGYQVLHAFEALHYQSQEYLERPFLLLFAKKKIEFTLANKLASKTEILDKENEMNLDIPVLKLRTSSNELSPLLQGFYKRAPNDIFGKFMAKPGPNTSIVHSNAEIYDVFFSKARKHMDVNPITEPICEVTTECITDWSFIGGNLMAGMAIVLEAQMFMLQKMTALMQRNVNVLGIATDGLFLSYPKTLDPPVEVSLTLGKFEDAYPRHEKDNCIKEFMALNSRDYCIQFMDGQMVVKLRGFNLTAPVILHDPGCLNQEGNFGTQKVLS